MSFAPSTRVAPLAPSAPVSFVDDLDQQYGFVVDESDLGYWSSDRVAGMDWDLPQASGVYESEEDRLFGYFDGMSTFDSDDYEYQQQLLY